MFLNLFSMIVVMGGGAGKVKILRAEAVKVLNPWAPARPRRKEALSDQVARTPFPVPPSTSRRSSVRKIIYFATRLTSPHCGTIAAATEELMAALNMEKGKIAL